VTGKYPKGVAWNGLTAVTESPSGAEATALYADDAKYLSLMSAEEFGATVEAYTYPDEFAACDGTAEIATGVLIGQQARKTFGMAYKTTLGNDTEGEAHGYKLHIVYGANASPSEKGYKTINDSPEAISFSWEVKTTPVVVTGFKPTASLTIDSTKVDAAMLTAIEDILFGTAEADPRLPLPD
jgi:K+-sensing histidine kinase KdpD